MTLGERIVRNDEVVGSIPKLHHIFKHFRGEGVSPIPCFVVVCVVTPSSTPGIMPPTRGLPEAIGAAQREKLCRNLCRYLSILTRVGRSQVVSLGYR